MTISVELTFEQLVKAIAKLRPEETEQLAQVVERHRREVEGVGAKAQRRLRQEALERMFSITEIISADRHSDGIEGVTLFGPKEFVQAQP